MVLSIALFVYSIQRYWITRLSNIHRRKKKKIPLSLIRSVLTPLWSLAASQSLQLEGGGESLLLWFLRYPGRAVGWRATGSAACWFVQAFNVLLDAASLWFTSLNVRLADRSNYWWRVLRRLGPQKLECLRGRVVGGGGGGDRADQGIFMCELTLSGSRTSRISTLECRPSILPSSLFQVGLIPRGFHSQSGALRDQEAGEMRVRSWTEENLQVANSIKKNNNPLIP